MKYLIGTLILFSLMAAGCHKKHVGSGSMTVRMKDAPEDYNSVNVEVVNVEVHYSGKNGGWKSLPTNAGMYNLLELQNNVTAVLSSGVELPAGDITQMRLILGNTNYIVVDSIAYPLDLTSQDKTGLKFNVNSTISEGDSVEVLIDFDVKKSVLETSATSFKLKPVIKVESIVYY